MSHLFDFLQFPSLETERLLLREMTPDDVNALLKLFGNAQVVKFLEMNPIKTTDQAEEWMRWIGGVFSASGGLRWGIERKSDGEFIGSAGLHSWNREAHYAELGFDIAQQHWEANYPLEVARVIIDFSWQQMNLNRLEVNMVQGNVALMKIMEQLGFKHEGIFRQRLRKGGKYYDVHLYGLLRKEYIDS